LYHSRKIVLCIGFASCKITELWNVLVEDKEEKPS